MHNGTGDGDALLLADGELAGLVVGFVGHIDVVKDAVDLAVDFVSPDAFGDADVLSSGNGGQEVEALEDEADLFSAESCAAVGFDVGDVAAVDPELARSRAEHEAEDVHEGALAAAGRSHNGDELAGLEGQVDVKEDGDVESALGEGFGDAFCLEQWLGHEGGHSKLRVSTGSCRRAR